ncbi:MAG: CDP-archaeol synthase [Nanoarchaeota archaeon]|nr:CDP-archaeol synthase [Nanoarchaeota archaeon]MBU1622334.1 CDP-archaeol synthase [Nanoarchaeota archaeon]MBU1974109.1 CDP-archaeol synthase [Nanoarchaeota archaeon]
MVLEIILKALYFFLPAYFANMAPILLKGIPALNKPIHEKLLGKNKTWRGFVLAVLIGTLIFYLQKVAYQYGFTRLALIDYANFSVLLGVLLGGGAIIGDLVESYFKRKNKIKPGERWVPWDQLDFVIGGLGLSLFLYVPPANVILILLLLSPLLHILFNHLGYWLRIRKSKW